MSKSPLKWVGGKNKLLPQMMYAVPKDYTKYIELFAGGASLFFHLKPKNATLCDINPELINFYTALRDDPSGLIEEIKELTVSAEDYERIRAWDRQADFKNLAPVKRASRFYYLNKTCFNGIHRVNSKGQFNVPFGNKKGNILDEVTLKECSKILQVAELRCCNFDDIVDDLDAQTFMYVDPPYFPLNVTSSFTSYTKEDFTTNDQIKLKCILFYAHSAGTKWMLSNSRTEFILTLYEDYVINTINAPRSINSDGDKRQCVKEVLITNYKVVNPVYDLWGQ
jgi:DNA adenine methylase